MTVAENGRQGAGARRHKLVTSSEALRKNVEHDTAPSESAPLADSPPAARYPEQLLPIAGVDLFAGQPVDADDGELAALRARYERFCIVREEALLDYGYNTARAYWGDLDDLFLWCEHRRFDIFELSDRQFREYVGLLRRRKYSESTIRRRGVSLRRFLRAVGRA